jgi:hypothetical protein
MDELGSRSSVVDVFARDSESGDIELFSRGMNSPFCQLDSMRFIEGNPDSVAAAETDDFPESAKCSEISETSPPLVFFKRSSNAGSNSELESARLLALGSRTILCIRWLSSSRAVGPEIDGTSCFCDSAISRRAVSRTSIEIECFRSNGSEAVAELELLLDWRGSIAPTTNCIRFA